MAMYTVTVVMLVSIVSNLYLVSTCMSVTFDTKFECIHGCNFPLVHLSVKGYSTFWSSIRKVLCEVRAKPHSVLKIQITFLHLVNVPPICT